MDCSMPGFPVLHSLLEFAQTHVHWVSDAIQPSYPLLPTVFSCPQSFPASGSFPMSQLFTSSGQSIGGSVSASVLAMNIEGWFPLGFSLENQSWIFIARTDPEAEAPILCPLDVKSWLIGKDSDAGKYWGLEEMEGNRGWDGCIAPPNQCTWVWTNARRW